MTGVGPEPAPVHFLRGVSLVKTPAILRRMAEAKISLHAGIAVPSDHARRILANSPT